MTALTATVAEARNSSSRIAEQVNESGREVGSTNLPWSMSEKYGPDVRKLVVSCIGLLFIADNGNKQQSSW